ncbi:hypothetical protein GCK72_023633 [Caenorhabditis remanei]|uniref:Uncharacterized protein n=1 Tax=Caenorhabditis remanei TaxID=31234 RepID=A0A6A5FXB5_CAERE|nr:hypothetical protein GCK72_023633 [Caenorhabditis remanei]KAF1747172.1 hypothetical protein GCK72_023633 [Caenorhabditis remanei]
MSGSGPPMNFPHPDTSSSHSQNIDMDTMENRHDNITGRTQQTSHMFQNQTGQTAQASQNYLPQFHTRTTYTYDSDPFFRPSNAGNSSSTSNACIQKTEEYADFLMEHSQMDVVEERQELEVCDCGGCNNDCDLFGEDMIEETVKEEKPCKKAQKRKMREDTQSDGTDAKKKHLN